MRRLAEAHIWLAVVAVSEQLADLDPAAADPDGLASIAREQLARQREAERAEAERRQRIAAQQAHPRQLAEAHHWSEVLAVSEELAGLDPTAADPDGLTTAARVQLEEAPREYKAWTAPKQAVPDEPSPHQHLPSWTLPGP